jgi:hypothetical protein
VSDHTSREIEPQALKWLVNIDSCLTVKYVDTHVYFNQDVVARPLVPAAKSRSSVMDCRSAIRDLTSGRWRSKGGIRSLTRSLVFEAL